MNTQQLETFIQVADNLNFARAAEVLNMTQSAVSRQIHSLEEELGVKLFLRTTRTVTLTPAGVGFLEDAKKVVNTLKVATAKAAKSAGSSIQVVTIGCGSEADLDLLGKILTKTRVSMPEVHPFVKVIPHRSILSLFSQGDIDVLCGFRDDVPKISDVSYREIADISICCALPDDLFLSEKSEISESELYSGNLILCNALPSKAVAIQEQIASHILPEKTYMCENLHATLAMIRAGYGFTITPKIEFSGVKCVPLTGTKSLSYGLFYKSDSPTAVLKKFLEAAV